MATDTTWLTTTEVADLFQVRRATVNRWVRENRLRSYRTPSGRARFRNEDVRRLLEVVHTDGSAA